MTIGEYAKYQLFFIVFNQNTAAAAANVKKFLSFSVIRTFPRNRMEVGGLGCVFYTYIDCSYSDHVGAIEFQPHLLNGFPELSTVLWTLPIHLHDVQHG